MEDKYLPVSERRKEILYTQIDEIKTLIYRNLLELILFKNNNEKARIKEVEYNNSTLAEKLDALSNEWDKVSEEKFTDFEARRGFTQPGSAL